VSGLGGETPRHGGRVSLKLLRLEDEQVAFEAVLRAAEEHWQAELRVTRQQGTVVWFPAAPAAPTWLTEFAVALARNAWRSSQTAPWPRRLTRWRAASE
jgi:hypothetical protein